MHIFLPRVMQREFECGKVKLVQLNWLLPCPPSEVASSQLQLQNRELSISGSDYIVAPYSIQRLWVNLIGSFLFTLASN